VAAAGAVPPVRRDRGGLQLKQQLGHPR
jgi:hypothetical protein